MQRWIRIFGAPNVIVSDQGGALASDMFAHFCEKFNIQRRLGGSDVNQPGGGRHTTTGVVEKHIDLVKTTMLKLHADLQENGVENVSVSEVLQEACAAQNELLTYQGVHPATAVFGKPNKDLFDLKFISFCDSFQ